MAGRHGIHYVDSDASFLKDNWMIYIMYMVYIL